MDSEILKYLSEKIHTERQVIIEDMSLGKAKDHGEYKYACGINRGLLIANNIIIEIVEQMERQND